MNPKSDEELVREVQNGSILAFEKLVRRYQRKLVFFAARILSDPTQAEDIVSEALFQLYRTIGRVDTSRKFSPYIFILVKNACISFLRSEKKSVPLDSVVLAEEDFYLYGALFQKDTRSRIKRVLRMLDEKYRTVITLYYFDDLTYEEIGKRMKIPLNTVRTYMRRGKEKIKKHITYESV